MDFVPGARVPVLCLQFGREATPWFSLVDLSVNNLLPVFNTRLLRAYARLDARVVPLVQARHSTLERKGRGKEKERKGKGKGKESPHLSCDGRAT